MKAKTIVLLAALAACRFASARPLGAGIEAFNRTFAADSAGSCVFSPLGFELDCVLFAESGDTLVRAGIAESIGVLTEFDATFKPVLDHFGGMAVSNGFRWVSARAFCVTDIRRSSRVFRNRVWNLYGAEVCAKNPPVGAEAYLRAKLDGDMEDFEIPTGDETSDRQLFYDLVSVSVAPYGLFPSAAVTEREFQAPGGRRKVRMVSGVALHGRHVSKIHTLARLPLKDGAFLYAVMPNEGHTLAEIRARFNPVRFEEMLLEPEMVGLAGTGTFKARITLPEMDFVRENDLSVALAGCKVPANGLVMLGPDSPGARRSRQRVRFRFGPNDDPPAEPAAKPGEFVAVPPSAPELVFDRPFLWFVHHPKTVSLPAMGVYAGE